MAKQATELTTADVYNLVDKKVGEVNISVQRLEAKFDALESGRLSGVETKVANIEGKLMMVPVLISIAIGIFGLIINLVLSRLK